MVTYLTHGDGVGGRGGEGGELNVGVGGGGGGKKHSREEVTKVVLYSQVGL